MKKVMSLPAQQSAVLLLIDRSHICSTSCIEYQHCQLLTSVFAAGLPAWGAPLLRPCDLHAVLTAAQAPGSSRPTLALSLHAPLLALQASPAALNAARVLAAAYVGANAPVQTNNTRLQAAPAFAPADALDGSSPTAPAAGAGTGGGHAGVASNTGAAEGAVMVGDGGAGSRVSGTAALTEEDLRSGLFTLATSPSSPIGTSV